MLSKQKNQGKNSSGFSTTPEQAGMFRSRPFTDQTASDEVSPQNQDLPDLQTLQDRSVRFSQSLSRMKVYGSRPAIQPKLSVGAPGDKYEQEADQMAQQVMSMPAPVSHPPIQRLEKQEEEKEPVQTKALAASITPLVQRETAPEELEEEKEPVQMKRSLQETAEVTIQRDGTDALPAVPNYQLTPPSLLQPPDPSSRYGLGQNSQLHLDPQIQAMAFQHVQQQMEPATIRAALSQINLGLTALRAPSASGPTATPTPNPFATPSPSPAAPLVPRGAGPDTPRPASAGDLMSALLAVPAIDAWITTLQTRATEQMMRDWRRLSTGEQVGAVSSAVAIGAGALAGILSDPNTRQMALSQLNGRVLPVPGLNWLSLEINTGGDNLMLGGHVDIGSLLPPSLGFGPSSPSAIGGPPTPQPFVPGQPPVQRKATPEAEEEKVQMKPLANAMIQREAMPEEEEKVRTKPLMQRAAEGGSHDASSNLESQLSSSKGGGSPLSDEVRSFMEPRFGADFSQVRVHTDSEAVQMNRDLSAQAFAHGSDIYFGAGKYNPGSSDGKRLLAHELTHVVQQAAAPVSASLSSRSQSLQRYGTPEHVKFGGEPDKQEMMDINGVKISYGEMISMGDFFEKPEDIYNVSKDKLEVLVKLIRESAKRGVSPKEWQDATDGRYADLAQKNTKHFSPSNPALVTPTQHQEPEDRADNRTTWMQYHGKAIQTALSGDLNKALAINGFADHFLTDAFAAGHLVNKPDIMAKFRTQLSKSGNGFFKNVAKKAWADSSVSSLMSEYQVVGGVGGFFGLTINSEWMFVQFLEKVDEAKPEALSGAITKALHDKLNTWFDGIPVKNMKGETWNLSGDDTLNAKSLEIGRKAVEESRKDIHEAFNKCVNFPPYNNVLHYLPTPTEEGIKIIKGQADILTDPNNSATVDAVASIVISMISVIANEAVKMNKLRKYELPKPQEDDPCHGWKYGPYCNG